MAEETRAFSDFKTAQEFIDSILENAQPVLKVKEVQMTGHIEVLDLGGFNYIKLIPDFQSWDIEGISVGKENEKIFLFNDGGEDSYDIELLEEYSPDSVNHVITPKGVGSVDLMPGAGVQLVYQNSRWRFFDSGMIAFRHGGQIPFQSLSYRAAGSGDNFLTEDTVDMQLDTDGYGTPKVFQKVNPDVNNLKIKSMSPYVQHAFVFLLNRHPSNNLILIHDSTDEGTTNKRFRLPNNVDMTVPPLGGVVFVHSGTWKAFSL